MSITLGREAARLVALRHYEILDTPLEPEFDRIARLAAALCAAPVALISLVDEDRQWFKARLGFDAPQTDLGRSICRHAIDGDGALFEIADTTQDARTASNPLVCGAPGVRFYAGAILRGHAGLPLGTLCVLDTVPRALTPEQADGLETLAHHVVALLEARLARRRLSVAVDASQRLFFTLDRSLAVTYANPAAGAFLGREVDDIVGRVLCSRDAADGRLGSALRGVLRSAAPATAEAPVGPSGRWLALWIDPTADGLAVHAVDVTEARGERERLRLLENAIAQTSDAVLITEADPFDQPGPRIVYANPAFEQQTGYALSEILGRSPRFLQGPDTDRAALDRIRDALSLRRPVRVELINYREDGTSFEVEIDIAPVGDASGATTHFVSVQREVTERRALEARLGQAQRLEAVGQLTAGVAHDFNNLLTVIMGDGELLAEMLPSDHPAQEVVAMSRNAARRGATLTARLLAFARRQPLAPRPADIVAVVEGLAAALRRTLGDAVALTIESAPGLWPAAVDATQLESALLNLAINARDAMPEGGTLHLSIAPQVVTTSAPTGAEGEDVAPGDYVAISLADSGQGMTPDVLARAVEPFFSTKAQGEGAGLGLSQVYGFAKQSRGWLTLRSAPGRGAVATIHLPRAAQAIEADDLVGRQIPAGHGETVLVVEDDDLLRQHVTGVLGRLGYRALVASNGREALGLFAEHPEIDVLFTDIVMPGGLNGREIGQIMKKARPGLPILYTSGYAADSLGGDDGAGPDLALLEKPYRQDDLAQRLHAALNG